jgi:hypothetical protein
VHADRVQMEQVTKEVVGMSGRDVPVGQDLSGKVVLVERDDDLGTCPGGGGEHVPAVWSAACWVVSSARDDRSIRMAYPRPADRADFAKPG